MKKLLRALLVTIAFAIYQAGVVALLEAQEALELQAVGQIGPDFGNGLFFAQIEDAAVDGEGNLYVLDAMNSAIYVFDPRGTLTRVIGSRGQGPGEFSNQLAQILMDDDGLLHVVDTGLGRLSTYELNGGFVGTISLTSAGGLPVAWAFLDDQTLIAELMPIPLWDPSSRPGNPSRPTLRLVSFESGLRIRDLTSVDVPPDFNVEPDGSITTTLFGPRMIWTVTEAREVVTARSDEYRLDVLDSNGEVARSFGRTVERRSVDSEFRALVRSSQEKAFEEAGIPESQASEILSGMRLSDRLPLIDALMIGPENTLFVKRGLGLVDWYHPQDGSKAWDEDTGAWDVFDSDGTYVGVIDFPVAFRPLVIRDDKIYGVAKSDLDVETLLILEFHL